MSDEFDTHESSPPTMPDPDDDAIDELIEDPPKWPTVVGTVSIVWAGLSLLGGVCGIVSMTFMPQFLGASGEVGPLPPTMQFGPIDWLLMGLGTTNAVVLLIAGITTVMRNHTGRLLHIFYGFLAFPLTGLGTFFQWGKQAQMAQWIQDNPDSPFAQQVAAGETLQVILFALGLLLALAWPVFCLIWFGLVKRTKASMIGSVEPVA